MISLILGSASPRRKEILSLFKFSFKVIPPCFDEESHPFQGDPQKYVFELSVCKSHAIKEADSNTFVLTADTIVFYDGVIYGKPKNREDARRILSILNGKKHTVYTGISLRKGSQIETVTAKTDVVFDTLTEHELDIYLDVGKWQDKAGGYAIQDEGALLIKEIRGCFYNVVGLPISSIKELFSRFGVDIWDYLKSN